MAGGQAGAAIQCASRGNMDLNSLRITEAVRVRRQSGSGVRDCVLILGRGQRSACQVSAPPTSCLFVGSDPDPSLFWCNNETAVSGQSLESCKNNLLLNFPFLLAIDLGPTF